MSDINKYVPSYTLTPLQELEDEFRRETKAIAEKRSRLIACLETGEPLAAPSDFVGWLIRKEEPKKPQMKKAKHGVRNEPLLDVPLQGRLR